MILNTATNLNNGYHPRCLFGYFNLLFLLVSFVSSSSLAFQFPPLIASFSTESPRKIASPKRVAVAGATGRTGKLVVQKLLERNKNNSNNNIHVVALVRDLTKAKETLPSDDSNISLVQCDLSNPKDIQKGKLLIANLIFYIVASPPCLFFVQF